MEADGFEAGQRVGITIEHLRLITTPL
ncbi:hypothetical protein DLM46_27665 [Paraburkholderia lacunae]|uniref:Uncharacterized protein n=1 Tax=Paraburkholderia lacunae TaxID=2211104 RepID=A0A370N2G3_9BURK|nr:hypothetical protein DLM46_27665 [Paraburkholderia lacunae]